MKVIELFAGIGAPRMALKKLKIPHEIIGISEIDNNAIKMYNLIHGETNNFGNIKKIEKLPDCDLLHASSPCISFSMAGKKDGLKGESRLLLEIIRLLKVYETLPPYFSFENIVEMKTRFADAYDCFIGELKALGYNIYSECLNAAFFDNPQKRERLFIIGIRKDIDKGRFIMPKNINPTSLRLKDILLPQETINPSFVHPQERFTNRHYRKQPIPHDTFQTIEDGYYFTKNSKARCQSNRIYNRIGLCPTITTVPFINILEKNFLRRAEPVEYWKAMGFDEKDFNKIKDNFSTSALIKAIGNSIALGPLEAIYKNLFIEGER